MKHILLEKKYTIFFFIYYWPEVEDIVSRGGVVQTHEEAAPVGDGEAAQGVAQSLQPEATGLPE